MKKAVIALLALAVAAACAGAAPSSGGRISSRVLRPQDERLGITARLPVGWHVRWGDLGGGPRRVYEHRSEEGFYGWDVFFRDHRCALQGLVCVDRAAPVRGSLRRRAERFLDDLRFARGGGPGRSGTRRTPSIHLGGRSISLVAGDGSVWALTCDRGCTEQARRRGLVRRGRVLRLDPYSGRIVSSAPIDRAYDLVVGRVGVFAINFSGGTVRRLDPSSLRPTAEIRLHLPFELVPGDRAFLPNGGVEARGSLWVSTDRGVLARLPPGLGHVEAMVRGFPFDAGGGIAAGEGSIWTGQQLAGVYRIDPARDRVAARIVVGDHRKAVHGLLVGDTAVDAVAVGGGEVFAVGTRVDRHQVSTGEEVLVRIDPADDRVEAVTPLPRPAIPTVAYADGSLWVGAADGSIFRVDPADGSVIGHLDTDAGAGFVVVGGGLWSASRDGTLRRRSIAGAKA